MTITAVSPVIVFFFFFNLTAPQRNKFKPGIQSTRSGLTGALMRYVVPVFHEL